MSNLGDQFNPDLMIEEERYELFEDTRYRFDVSRRGFVTAVGAGLVVLCLVHPAEGQDRSRRPGGGGGGGRGSGAAREIGAWIHIDEDGRVTVHTGKVEMGQDTRTATIMTVAEELSASTGSIDAVMGDTDLVPYDRGTWGSQSTPSMLPQVRRAAAAAREVLVDLARDRWEVDRGSITVKGGQVKRTDTGETLGFGDLTKGKRLTAAIDEDTPVASAEHWQVCGKSHLKVDARDIVTGRTRFASDVKRPGMLAGLVLRGPSLGATIASIDLSKAKAMTGVTVVHDGDFVGVAAPDDAAARRALQAIKVQWTEPEIAVTHATLFDHLRNNARGGGGRRGGANTTGNIEDGLAKADHRISHTYTLPYIAHVPLETRVAVAEWGDDGRVTIWTGTQAPFGVRAEVAQTLRVPEERVRVIVPPFGSGYGGKTRSPEAPIEAARLARAARRPVRVAWSRKEEFWRAYFRPAGVIDIESGVTEDGTITAWRARNFNAGGSGLNPPYAIAHQHNQTRSTDSPLRQGSYRCLAGTGNIFAIESQVDEMAGIVGIDPVAFRRKNIEDVRLRAVLDAAVARFDWDSRESTPDRGFGVACASEKGAKVASCVEVSIDRRRGEVRVEHIVTAFECGAIVNPDAVENQVEGSIMMAIGGGLFEQIEFRDGRITNGHLNRYRLPRFSDMPRMETILINRTDLPSAGAGEAGIVTLAPAVGNAIQSATGIRLRAMPLVKDGLDLS